MVDFSAAYQLALKFENLQMSTNRKSTFKFRKHSENENNAKSITIVPKDVKGKTTTGESSPHATKRTMF